MTETRLQLLQNMPIFGGMSEKILKLLVGLAPAVHVPKGEYFFREGDQASSLFVLQAGRVAVLKGWDGHDYLLRYLEKGDCFGEMALMDLCPRSASVRAVEDSAAMELSYAVLDDIQQQDLQQYALLQMNMGREVSRRLRKATLQLFETKVAARFVDGSFVLFSP